jgi:hypothetical protein
MKSRRYALGSPRERGASRGEPQGRHRADNRGQPRRVSRFAHEHPSSSGFPEKTRVKDLSVPVF